MVAKITTPKSIKAALNYNEKKVQQGQAVCLAAANYLQNTTELNFYQKLAGFERLNELNDRATTKTIHVSLNFDPSEKHANDKLIAIAGQYMEKIGFGKQPFLVYEHNDAGHPHIHIVSTTIQNDGSRINTHNIGRNQSEKARKEIEQQYGLVKAERLQQLMNPGIKAANAEKATYGKSETKRSIANTVTAVFSQYKFTSLPEYNAALKQFNVVADRGKEQGRIYRNRGLVYHILDASGNKVGVPIKASSIGCKPTLDNVEKKFVSNAGTKEKLQPFVRAKLDECLAKAPGSISILMEQLQQKNIYTLLRQNEQGRLYGITFIDNQNKVVFNGSDLGKGYAATALQSKLSVLPATVHRHTVAPRDSVFRPGQENKEQQPGKEKSMTIASKTDHLLDALLQPKDQFESMPYGLKKKRKKKKKKTDL